MWSEVLSAWWFWAVPVAFVAVLVYAFNPRRKKQFDAEARVPMDTDAPANTKTD
jgi:cbb3-type cytochrome oxidase subunit 3